MDPSSLPTSHPSIQQDDDDDDIWDTDGFVIPSLGIQDLDDQDKAVETQVEQDTKTSACKDGGGSKEEEIYLGPHGAPPQVQPKQQEQNPSNGRKQKLKQKLKEADRRTSGSGGRENKLENLRDLVGAGGGKTPLNMPNTSTRDWLDPHCHESEFDKPNR